MFELERKGRRKKIPRISDLLLVAGKSIAVAFGVKAKRLSLFIFYCCQKMRAVLLPLPQWGERCTAHLVLDLVSSTDV
jgi:hypothetical protein